MAQGAIQRWLISAAMEVVNCGHVHGDSTNRSNAHVEGIHVRHIILVLRALNPGDIPGVGLEASLSLSLSLSPPPAREGRRVLFFFCGNLWEEEERGG